MGVTLENGRGEGMNRDGVRPLPAVATVHRGAAVRIMSVGACAKRGKAPGNACADAGAFHAVASSPFLIHLTPQRCHHTRVSTQFQGRRTQYTNKITEHPSKGKRSHHS